MADYVSIKRATNPRTANMDMAAFLEKLVEAQSQGNGYFDMTRFKQPGFTPITPGDWGDKVKIPDFGNDFGRGIDLVKSRFTGIDWGGFFKGLGRILANMPNTSDEQGGGRRGDSFEEAQKKAEERSKGVDEIIEALKDEDDDDGTTGEIIHYLRSKRNGKMRRGFLNFILREVFGNY